MVDRDYEILKSFRKHRLHTRETLRDMFFPGCDLNAVSKVLSRLRKSGLVARHRGMDGASYYTLGTEPPLGPTALVTKTAVVSYCAFANEPLLDKRDMARDFPFMPVRDGAIYCHGNTGLRQLRTDLGADSDVILRKIKARHRMLIANPGYRFLVHGERFSVRVLTGTEDKALEINRLIEAAPTPISCRAVVIPCLLPLLARKREA